MDSINPFILFLLWGLMGQRYKKREGSSGYVKLFVLNFIRLMLVLAIIGAYFYERDLVFVIAFIGLLVTFIPTIIKRVFRFQIPAEFEIIVLFFIYGLLVFGETRGFYFEFWWWDILLNLGGAIILGFVGLSVFYALEDEEVVEPSPFVLIFFTFCFAFSVGALWEVFEFFLDTVFGFGLQKGGLSDTMIDLIVNAIGALFVSEVGYVSYRLGKKKLFSNVLFGIVKKNSKLFKSKRSKEHSSSLIERLIKGGEGDYLEFKSTLRKNLYTGEIDKRIEHSVLKTIVGYLNSKGGTLIVGVDDKGEVLGLENDEFSNHDKLRLYLTGVLRNYLGNQFLSYISFELYPYKEKYILKIDCLPSEKRVFLRWENEEEFFVRHGASTIKLQGSDLIDYVEERF